MARQARKLQKTKKPTVRVGPMAAKNIAIQGYGSEPALNLDLTQGGLANALNWYSCVQDPDAHVESLMLELKDRNYSKEDIAAVRRAVNSKGFWQNSVLNIARMLQRQIKMPADTLERWEQKVKGLVELGRTIREEKIADAEEKGIVLSIQERTDNKANEMFVVFDDLAEEIWTGVKQVKDLKFFELFKEMDIKPGHARRLVERFKEEATKYEENPKDYTKDTLKVMVPYWNGLLEAASTWASEKQVKPKTDAQLKKESVRRALTSAKKESKAVSGLKYKASDDDTGVISSNPNGIIGAQVVVLYNTKYNLLTTLYAKGAAGLSIKGTSIINYDESLSQTKRAGRAGPLVKVMSGQSKTALKKSFDSLKGTAMEAKNRTSEEVVIVRIIK